MSKKFATQAACLTLQLRPRVHSLQKSRPLLLIEPAELMPFHTGADTASTTALCLPPSTAALSLGERVADEGGRVRGLLRAQVTMPHDDYQQAPLRGQR